MIVGGGDGNVDQCQHCKHQRLNGAEQELEEEEDHRDQHRDHQEPDLGGNGVHHAQQRFTGKDVAEETGGERNDARKLTDHFDREDERRVGHVLEAADDPMRLDAVILDGGEGDERQRQRHVQVGGWWAQERHEHGVLTLAFFRGWCSSACPPSELRKPYRRARMIRIGLFGDNLFDADRADTWEESGVIGDQNKDEETRNEREDLAAE